MPAKSLPGLPLELLLEIVLRVPFEPATLAALRLSSTHMNRLILHHERYLTAEIKKRQFETSAIQLFPGLVAKHNWTCLAELSRRLTCLDTMHSHWLQIVNHGVELQWLKGRWEKIHLAGLLLLFRLQDAGDVAETGVGEHEATKLDNEARKHANKVALLESLPATSLACLLFKLISSIKILRVHGPPPLQVRCVHCEDPQMRSEVELVGEELLLRHGPSFFIELVKAAETDTSQEKSRWAVDALHSELASMVVRQYDPSRPTTLIASLRRALAQSSGCEIHRTVSKMWELLSCTGFDEMDSAMVARVVRGESLEGQLGMRVSVS